MSLFNLIKQERNVLNSQSFFESVLTGQFIGKCGVDHLLNNCEIYVDIREAVASFFSAQIHPQLDPITDKMTDQLLLRIRHGQTSKGLFPGIAKIAIVKSLEPLARTIVKNSIRVFVHKGIEDSFDAVCEKGISLAMITTIYHIALSALKCPFLNKHNLLSDTINLVNQYLPSPSIFLYALTAFHVAAMVHVIWNTGYLNRENSISNKDEIKELIIEETINPFRDTLEEKRTFRALSYALSEEKIDALVSYMINELIDHCYWDHLHQIRILNIPLVS